MRHCTARFDPEPLLQVLSPELNERVVLSGFEETKPEAQSPPRKVSEEGTPAHPMLDLVEPMENLRLSETGRVVLNAGEIEVSRRSCSCSLAPSRLLFRVAPPSSRIRPLLAHAVRFACPHLPQLLSSRLLLCSSLSHSHALSSHTVLLLLLSQLKVERGLYFYKRDKRWMEDGTATGARRNQRKHTTFLVQKVLQCD